jgi:hypothetical protein
MKLLKVFILGVAVLSLTGCGQKVVETLKVSEPVGPNAPGAGRSIVVLPFADYTFSDNLASAHRRNLQVTESVTDRLIANGFAMPIQEDVVRYMINQNLISLVAYEESHSSSLTNELSGEWSNEMKTEIRRYIVEQQVSRDNRLVSSPGTHGLSENTVRKIGRRFNADYIVRGRLLEYKTREDPSWAPWRKGVLPFVVGGTSQVVYGFAESDQYDRWNQTTVGAGYGALIGSSDNTIWPFENDGSGNTILGMSSSASNAIFWGFAGGWLGELSTHSGRLDQAVVQMRIWVQEASSGNVVWTNRVRVQVSPQTVFSDSQYDVLFDQAIEKGVTALIDSFVTSAL